MKHFMQVRQGDVFVERIKSIPAGAERTQVNAKRIILAEGESTGHAHAIEEVEKVEFFNKNGLTYLRVFEDVPLLHEEHKAPTFYSGDYQVVRQVEFDPAEVRQVVD
mgnify:CR=1 FL=1